MMFSHHAFGAGEMEDFAARKKLFISQYDTSKMVHYNTLAVRYALNKDIEWADAAFLKLLENKSGAMFWMYRVMGAYILGKDKMSPKVKKAVREAWRTYAPARGDTENHWALYYACMFLAAEQWPNEPGSMWFNGMSSTENWQEAHEYLISWVKLTTTKGQGEFDSPDYLHMYVIAMTMLAEFAEDEAMKKRATMVTDYLMADFAVDHLDQLFAGGHSRIYERNLMNPDHSGSSTIAWLYFGVGKPQKNGWLLIPALTSYQVPEIVRLIATDRETSYLSKERKRVRHNIRFSTEQNPPVYKTTWMTKDYALSSLQGGLLQPIQQLTWSVKYKHGRPYSNIFGLHPSWSTREIGMFFPEQIKVSMAGIVASKKTYNNPNKWTGGSDFERTYQHKNTLIVLYDIPVGETASHIDGFFPANLDERIEDESGWIFSKAGDVYIAWYPLQPYFWQKEYALKKIAFNEKTGSKVDDGSMPLRNYRLRSAHLQNGYVVEVRSKDEVGSFDFFVNNMKNLKPEAILKPGNVQVDYKNLASDSMHFKFPNERSLNGKTVDLSKFKLFESPYLNAEIDSENLTLRYKKMKLVLDFKKLTKKKNY